MQLMKRFTGSIGTLGSTAARPKSFGGTGTLAAYASRVDKINGIVADFLREDCGVDAVYQARSGSTGKFLWIWDAAFLFMPPASNNLYFAFYGPYYDTPLMGGSSTGTNTVHNFTFFSGTATSVNYDFGLVFTGNSDSCFCLRPIRTGENVPQLNGCIKFLKAQNPLNGRHSIVFAPYTSRNGYMRAVDILEDGSMDSKSAITVGTNYNELLFTSQADRDNNPGKLPLLPLNLLGREAVGVYHYPQHFGLPEAALNTTVNQVEVEIAGRRFIITDRDEYANGNICLGLIEVLD